MEEVKCKIELTLSDVRKAVSQKSSTRLYNVLMALCLITSIVLSNLYPNTKDWMDFIGFFSAIALVAPYLYRLGWAKKYHDRLYKRLNDAWMIVNSEGIHFTNNHAKNSYNWNQVKSITETEDFVFVRLFPRYLMIVNKKHCGPDELSKLHAFHKQFA